MKGIKEKYKPLIMWLKGQASEVVRDGGFSQVLCVRMLTLS